MPAKIRVLHIIKSLGRGGAEMLLPEALKRHDQTRFEFHYVYFLPWKNQMVSAISKNGGIISCIKATNNIQIILKAPEIVRYIKRNNIDLMHCHLPWAGVVGRIVHRWTGVPLIYTEHNKQERYHWITRWLNRLTFNWQTTAIAVSKDVADSIRKNIPVHTPVEEIVNGVDTDYFQRDTTSGIALRKQLGIPENALVIGTIAVFRFQKRLNEWIEVFASMSSKYPEIHGIMVGDGPLKDELVAKVNALGLQQRLILPGLQTDVKPWLSAIDVFVMSSIFEGLPVALLEAMSMECAIVTTDAGGVKEVIQHEKNGLMVPVDNWKSLEIELTRLLEQAPLKTELAASARTRVVDAFDMRRMVVQLESCYDRYIKLAQ